MTPNKRSFEKICMCTQLCLRKIDDICAPNSALNKMDDIKTFTENWDSKAPSVGTLFRHYSLDHIFFRNKTFLLFKIKFIYSEKATKFAKSSPYF